MVKRVLTKHDEIQSLPRVPGDKLPQVVATYMFSSDGMQATHFSVDIWYFCYIPEDHSETKVEGLVVKKNPNRATFAILWRRFDCLIVL